MPKTGLIVHVVAFEPKPDGPNGVGGFDWFPTATDADEEYERERANPIQRDNDFYRFDALVTSTRTATEEIDAAWEDWARFSKRPQPIDLRA